MIKSGLFVYKCSWLRGVQGNIKSKTHCKVKQKNYSLSILREVLAQSPEPEVHDKCLTIIQIELEFGNVVWFFFVVVCLFVCFKAKN